MDEKQALVHYMPDEPRCPVCNGKMWPHCAGVMYCPNCCKYYDMAADGMDGDAP